MALTRETLIEHLVEEYDLDEAELAAGALLFSTGRLDSFMLVELVMYLEDQAGVKIRPIDFTLDNLDSVERMLTFLSRKAG